MICALVSAIKKTNHLTQVAPFIGGLLLRHLDEVRVKFRSWTSANWEMMAFFSDPRSKIQEPKGI